MTASLRDSSIYSKLTAMNLLVSGTALLLACLAFIAYDLSTYRTGLVRSLSAQAQVIGLNSASSLVFDDPQTAQATLAALKGTPDIVWAAILTPSGKIFAQIGTIPQGAIASIPLIAEGGMRARWASGSNIVLARPIEVNARVVGWICLEANLREVAQHALQYALIAVAVMLVSLLLAQLATSRFRRSIVAPIRELATTARIVSHEKNYAIRAAPSPNHDELAVLIDVFNSMLAQIEHRDAELQRAHDDLEERVRERTSQLVAANCEMEAFSYSVAHDLRGPLEGISNLSYILEVAHEEQLDEDGRSSVRQLREAAKRMGDLINDLLSLSRAATTPISREPLDLTAMARSIDAAMRLRDPERNVEFSTEEGIVGEGDAGLVRIVLENLIGNAWKYTSHHARARIHFGSSIIDGERTYFVNDDGAGFDQQNVGRLFAPFQRLHSEADFTGTGIGLATVKRIIQRHGGHLSATGEVERGATFYFTL